MKLTSKGLVHGYNSMVREEVDAEMRMDFGVLCLDKGDEQHFVDDKEVVYVLMSGAVEFVFGTNRETAERASPFHDDPVVLHVPAGTKVAIRCLSEKAEVAIQRTTNANRFPAELMRRDVMLTPSEMRGAGLMNEASTRIVRTFFDRKHRPGTNFFIGEVVSFPGKWSSFPPHTHVEPEIYYYKFLPENGYGYAEINDDVFKVRNNDLTGMANQATHSQTTAPGYAEYYIWVIRLRDNEALVTAEVPEHKWAGQPTAKFFPEI